jgi:hypothetical protein
MALRSWFANTMITWGWRWLTPDQRGTFLVRRRFDLLAALTTKEHLSILEAVHTPTSRAAIAHALLAGLRPKADPYVY